MKKHQLSIQYRLTTPQDISDSDNTITTQLKQGEIYGLMDTASGDCVLITGTMHTFLKSFETPKTLEEVAEVLASNFNCTWQEVMPIAQQFLDDMKQRGVVLPIKAAERIEIIKSYDSGTLIDRYRIEENLSVNLPLEVYKATDLTTEQPVILKMLRLIKRLTPRRLIRWREIFRKEFAVQKILTGHPNICALLDLTPDYAVLEWIEGNSLRRRLAEGGPIDVELRETLLSQILETYAFMHSKNILHGDVHANNILLTKAGKIKIIDFDLAHQLNENNKLPNARGGVPEYIPPENISFDAFSIVKGKANYRTEVYQLGIIAYWMTYGKLPFTGDVWQDLANDILKKEIDFASLSSNFASLSSNNEKISPQMILFLKKSLAKNPKNRFESAIEMNNAYQELKQLRIMNQ